jgi:hypothetical protein
MDIMDANTILYYCRTYKIVNDSVSFYNLLFLLSLSVHCQSNKCKILHISRFSNILKYSKVLVIFVLDHGFVVQGNFKIFNFL